VCVGFWTDYFSIIFYKSRRQKYAELSVTENSEDVLLMLMSKVKTLAYHTLEQFPKPYLPGADIKDLAGF
jgi:hypothetical protein